MQSLRPSVRPSVRSSVHPSVPKSCHRNSSETTDPIIMKLGMWIDFIWCYAYWQEILIPSFLWELCPWNLENIRKSTNNISFLCHFYINEITASDAGPDIIRSHLLKLKIGISSRSSYHFIQYNIWGKVLTKLFI